MSLLLSNINNSSIFLSFLLIIIHCQEEKKYEKEEEEEILKESGDVNEKKKKNFQSPYCHFFSIWRLALELPIFDDDDDDGDNKNIKYERNEKKFPKNFIRFFVYSYNE